MIEMNSIIMRTLSEEKILCILIRELLTIEGVQKTQTMHVLLSLCVVSWRKMEVNKLEWFN